MVKKKDEINCHLSLLNAEVQGQFYEREEMNIWTASLSFCP